VAVSYSDNCGSDLCKRDSGCDQTELLEKTMNDCNYCNLQRIRKRAKAAGEKVSKRINRKHGGVDIYTYPKTVTLRELRGARREQYFRAWYMELPDKCAC